MEAQAHAPRPDMEAGRRADAQGDSMADPAKAAHAQGHRSELTSGVWPQ